MSVTCALLTHYMRVTDRSPLSRGAAWTATRCWCCRRAGWSSRARRPSLRSAPAARLRGSRARPRLRRRRQLGMGYPHVYCAELPQGQTPGHKGRTGQCSLDCADAQVATLHSGRRRAPGRPAYWRSGWHHVLILRAGEAKFCSFLSPFLTRSCLFFNAPAKARASCATDSWLSSSALACYAAA